MPCIKKVIQVAELNLDDARGYWRDLAAPAYEDFRREYQRDVSPKQNLLLVYRRLICASLMLNHQADKVAGLHGKDWTGNRFMDLVAELDFVLGYELHACRLFANDAKHDMKRIHEASTRPREAAYDETGEFPVLVINMLSVDGRRLSDMCRIVGQAWKFWISYFDGSGVLSYHAARIAQLGAKTSSTGSS